MFHRTVSINYRNAIGKSLQQQIPTIVLCSLLLDGGMMLRVCLVATIAFWLFAMIILVRSERFQEPKTDRDGLLFLRWGYFPVFLVFLMANQFVNRA